MAWRASSVLCLLLLLAASHASSQAPQLRVVDVAPRGVIAQRGDAAEIRIVFSEPMVALGRIPASPDIPWVRISPAPKGTWRWSGTTILLFTVDPDAPLPWATEFTVTIDGSATAVSGRELGETQTFRFTTPTPRLQSMRWFRRDDRHDRPVVLLLDFNQPMRAEDVLAHAALRYTPHDVTVPELAPAARERLAAVDPAGLRAFDQKVAAARQAASRTDRIEARATRDWDRERYPASPTLVGLETVEAPPPGTWIELTLDEGLVGAAGRVPAGQVQRSVAELDPVFFARGFRCQDACDPSAYNGLELTVPVPVGRFAAALSVQDITDPAGERPVARTSIVPASERDLTWSPSAEDAGYDRQPPASRYAYRLDASLEAADGQQLGYPFVDIVETWHERAFTSFGDGHGVWEVDGGLVLPFSSRNYTDVTQWLARLPVAELVPRMLALERSDFRDLPPGPGTHRQLPVTADAIQAHGLDLSGVLPDGRGLVWAGLRPGTPIPRAAHAVPPERADRSTIVQVTNLGITVKDSPQSTLVFVTRLDTGDPVDGATVSILDTRNQQVWRGTTGRDGVAVAPALPLRTPDRWWELSFVVTAEKDGDLAYVGSNWNEGILPWDFGHPFELWESTDILRGSVFTDRGVYRPGETVHVKAIVRLDTPQGIRLLPEGSPISVRVTDSRGRDVDRRTVQVNRWSSAEWTWTVPADASLGDHVVRLALPGADEPDANAGTAARAPAEAAWLKQISGTFLVAAYRRPDFRVTATLSSPAEVSGATLTGRIEASYLFGAPLGERPVRWSIRREPVTAIPPAILDRFSDDQWAFGYYASSRIGAERVAGADAMLDPSGTITVQVSTPRDVDGAWRYTLEGDVEDVSRQHIADRTAVTVHPAPWYVGLRRPAYFTDVATGADTEIVAVGLDGTIAPGVPVTVELTRIQWNSVRRAEGGGFYTWETEEVRTPAGRWTITTADTPVPLHVPVGEGGSYILSAVATDAEGRRTRTETHFYALGRGYTAWQRFDHNRITLEPERQTWRPGETARVMIQSPWETATALLTIEREGVRRYERFTLTSTQHTVEIPLTVDDIPNVFVSVLLIRGRTSDDPGADGSDPGRPAFRLGYTELIVDDATRALDVDVEADREEYRPNNTARVRLSVRDAEGRPARAEVTLWAVDEGVLSLTGYVPPDIRSAVYQRKALQVMTGDSRQRIVSRRVLTPKGADEGGGGGFEQGLDGERRDFRPLAFWLGSIETDATGTAEREVTLPDALTTYRILAVAADTASRFGSAAADIRVATPVAVLTALPRFLTVGDRGELGATVTSTLTRSRRATVRIRSLDPTLLAVDESTAIDLAPGRTAAVRVPATAQAAGTARVRIEVRAGSERDALEMTLPIVERTAVATVAAAGEVVDTASERLVLPVGVRPDRGGLTVELSASALIGLRGSARYLIEYPHGCGEQQASAALALALAARLGGAFRPEGLDPAVVSQRAAAALAGLSRYQCPNGGFALWAGACSTVSAYLSAYVLHVLKTTAGAGFEPDAAVVTRALDYLEAELRQSQKPAQVQWEPVWAATHAFAVKVLAEHGRNQDSNITRLLGVVDRLPIFALSYLADALAASNLRSVRYDDVIRRITNAVRVEGATARVDDLADDALGWIWHSDERTAAIVLEGFLRRGDNVPFTAALARGLLDARENGRWTNTQDNAMSLHALTTYYQRVEPDAPGVGATVELGGRTIGTATFTERTDGPERIELAMPDLLRHTTAGAETALTVARSGTGPLYYVSRLRYVPTGVTGAAANGIRVERRYEPFVEDGTAPPAERFAAGDLVRVTIVVDVPQERRYVAITDPLPAGLEAVDSFFRTTAADLVRDAERATDAGGWWFERGGFDHVERHDDRVQLFATRLAAGRHEFSYVTRATTAGTFAAAPAEAEAMYAPEINGRTAPVTIVIE